MTTLTPSYHAEDYSPDDNRARLTACAHGVWFFGKMMPRSGGDRAVGVGV